MKIATYMKSCIWELLLCILISASMSLIIFNGFYIAEKLQTNYGLLILIVCVTTSLCVIGAYNKKSIVIATCTGAAILAAAVVIVHKMGIEENLFHDTESSPGIYFLILILTSLAVFFLCRTKAGTGILFVLGAFIASFIEFLYETADVWMLLVFLCSSGAMYIYKGYQKNILVTDTVKTDFAKTFMTSAIICLLVVALSSGIFYGVVKPLDPPERELKLITKYMALEVLEKMGVADTHIINDSPDSTDNVNNNENDSNKKGDKEDKTKGDKKKQEDKDKKDKKNNPTKLDELFNQLFYAIKYAASIVTSVFIIPIIILLIAAAVLIKLLLRKRWFKKLLMHDERYQIIALYQFYIKKLHKFKIHKAPEETPYEFAERADVYLQDFRVDDITFAELTRIYVKARYSQLDIESDEYQSYLLFHKMFYKNCREHLGTFKYILKFFTL